LTWRLLVVASLLLCSARPQAQQSKETQKNPDEEVVTVRSHLVNVDVSVKDGKGNYVNDLRAEDFTVFENGVRQKVEFFNPPLAGASRAAGETATHADGPTPLAQRGMPRNIISLVLDGQTTEQQNLKPLREGTL